MFSYFFVQLYFLHPQNDAISVAVVEGGSSSGVGGWGGGTHAGFKAESSG